MTGAKSISEADFRVRLEAAVDEQPREYVNSCCLHFHFQNDNSCADQDASTLQLILQQFTMSAAEEYVLDPSSTDPETEVRSRFRDARRQMMDKSGRSLVIVHFAGHSGFNQYGRSYFRSTPNVSLPTGGIVFDTLLKDVDEESGFDLLPHSSSLDILFIIDSCIGRSTISRYPSSSNRIVELLAAGEGDYEDDTINVRKQDETLTSKLLDYILKRKQTSRSVQLADAVAAIRAESSTHKAVHRITVGPNSISLVFPEQNFDPPTPNVAIPNAPPSTSTVYPAVFSVHISETLTDDEMKQLVGWVRDIGKDRGFAVNGAYRTNSTALILQTPYSVYTQLSTLPGIELIFENMRNSQAQPNESARESGNVTAAATTLILQAPYDIYVQLRNIPGVNLVFENVTSSNLARSRTSSDPTPATHDKSLMGSTEESQEESQKEPRKTPSKEHLKELRRN
ncbi:hypothetical protein GX50_07088 [[Emmonsia] crescens]|uniref:Uncharacterized protein n=1 Tax=[Emmonsia] crescens TaxID=73230 RepID=A0A2B7Z1C2_9EURO|nr:hypothetical protein GX50_07088 [Emmonsia crescens]